MKKGNKAVFFIVFAVILAFAASTVVGLDYQYGDISTTYIHGLDDIRLGIDIQGGVDVTFEPENDIDATEQQLAAATEVIKLRLATLNINDSEVYSDANSNRIIVRFPWQAGEENFDPEAAVDELGETAVLTFRYGNQSDVDEEGNPTGEIILQGSDVAEAGTGQQPNDMGGADWVVTLKLTDEGKQAFADATTELATEKGTIAIWMDNYCISCLLYTSPSPRD